jgi:hydrogenase expression/formation protein HypE
MEKIGIQHGNGGREMQDLLQRFCPHFFRGSWQKVDQDAAILDLEKKSSIAFTTDSFVVEPLEFPGGNIGDLAFSGTVNDLVVSGAEPIGISCSLILEEGLEFSVLDRVLRRLNEHAQRYNIPIATGDTKVVERGSLGGMVINTAGLGVLEKRSETRPKKGDQILLSGSIGEHAVALLSQRFDFETEIISDSKPLLEEMRAIRPWIKIAKDPTRGGVSACLKELAVLCGHRFVIEESALPIEKSVRSAVNLLGLDVLTLANEGRLICIVDPKETSRVLERLKKFHPRASVIGEVGDENLSGRVDLQTDLGVRPLSWPSGKIVPRIC